MRGVILVCVLALLVVSCGDGGSLDQQAATTALAESPTTAAADPTTTTVVEPATAAPLPVGCAEPLAEPGEYEELNVYGDVEQAYWMVVPETYADVAPAPLYLHLASGGGDHNGFLEGWRPYLDDLDGLMAMVNTTVGGPPPGRSSPDVLVALIDQVTGEYCVDPSRVHVMGTSWSSQMAERLACEAADRIASFVGAGSTPAEMCTPARPVPVWGFTGDPDRATTTRSVEKWVGINACDPEPVVEDLGSGVFRKTYENCEADVVFYDIEGMGHKWPMHEAIGPGAKFIAEFAEVDYLEDVLDFFADHPLP